MIGIADIAFYIPERRLPNRARAAEFGLTDDFIRDKLGVEAVARKADDQDTSDLAVEAVKALLGKGRVGVEQIECLALVTQNPDGRGLPHTSAIVHDKLGLGARCLTFDISLGCSGYVTGLSVLTATMQSHGMRYGLLVTADPYSKIVDPADRNTALLFGDAASATLLAADPVWHLGRSDFGSIGRSRRALELNEAGNLAMNGRGVFDFSATSIPASIQRTAELNEIGLAAVDRFILHQGSRYIVDTIAKRLGVLDRTPFDAAEYGNTVSSSIPIALARAVDPSDRLVMISGFGVGLSWATTLLRRAPA